MLNPNIYVVNIINMYYRTQRLNDTVVCWEVSQMIQLVPLVDPAGVVVFQLTHERSLRASYSFMGS